jgi:hypothetical protein
MKKVSTDSFFENNSFVKSVDSGICDSVKRNRKKIIQEYELGEYAKAVTFNVSSSREIRYILRREHGLGDNQYVSFGDDIFASKIDVAYELKAALLNSCLNEFASENYCELGCGYGYNLEFLKVGGNKYGGEYCNNAVRTGRKLGINISSFDYYSTDSYSLIIPNSTVFTVHSIEQLPDCSSFIEGLRTQKENINYVVHFEPSFSDKRATRLGYLRNEYILRNDYNKNLLKILESTSDINLLQVDEDYFGLNPLNIAHKIVWEFKR